MKQGRAHLTKPGWRKPHTHSTPTNLVLFGHKITLYRFNHGAHTIAGGLKSEQGADTLLPLTLTTGGQRLHGGELAKYFRKSSLLRQYCIPKAQGFPLEDGVGVGPSNSLYRAAQNGPSATSPVLTCFFPSLVRHCGTRCRSLVATHL